MSEWQVRDTSAVPGTPDSALYLHRDYGELMFRLLPEARSGSTTMGRWLVIPPPTAAREQLDELRGLGVQVATR